LTVGAIQRQPWFNDIKKSSRPLTAIGYIALILIVYSRVYFKKRCEMSNLASSKQWNSTKINHQVYIRRVTEKSSKKLNLKKQKKRPEDFYPPPHRSTESILISPKKTENPSVNFDWKKQKKLTEIEKNPYPPPHGPTGSTLRKPEAVDMRKLLLLCTLFHDSKTYSSIGNGSSAIKPIDASTLVIASHGG
jgi:hypothetical protein